MIQKISLGFDVHPLVPGRKLILGGVEIPFYLGLYGHSDGDVIFHSIADAILKASGSGDIGTNFPDSSEKYKNINSSLLLIESYEKARAKGWNILSIDTTVVCDYPVLSPFYSRIKNNICSCLNIEKEKVSISARTTEKIIFGTRQDSIVSISIVLLAKEK